MDYTKELSSNDVYEKAFEIIKKRRAEAIRENERRIEEVNQKVPQINVINNELFRTGRELINIILSGNETNVQKKINQIKKDNIDAQKTSALFLKTNGYPEDYLEIHFTCPECKDTGYKNGYYCECLKSLVGKIKSETFNKNTHMSLKSFDTFKLDYYRDNYDEMKRIFDYLVKYANEFSLDSESILFYGDTGVGKTHLSLAVANVVINNGFSVIYDSVINILQKLRAEYFSYKGSDDVHETIMNVDLLILDDLGTEDINMSFYVSAVYNIVNTRLNKGKPTIISTNLNFDGIKNRYEARVASRLNASYKCLRIKGNDIRFEIGKNNVKK